VPIARAPFPWRGWLTAAIVVAVLVWSARGTGVNARAFVEGLPKMTEYFQRLLPSP
jgi:ABC-type phosphate/phosphonate transport system permease subunit